MITINIIIIIIVIIIISSSSNNSSPALALQEHIDVLSGTEEGPPVPNPPNLSLDVCCFEVQ